MSATKNNIENLWKLYVAGKASPKEVQALFDYIRDESNDEESAYLFKQAAGGYQPNEKPDPAIAESVLQSLLKSITSEATPAVHRVHFLRRWGWAAAAIILLTGSALYIFTEFKKSSQPPVAITKTNYPEVLAGGNKAVLTLSNGTSITLDSAANGTLAHEGHADIVKLNDGRIAYHSKSNAQEKTLINTMATPRGGQYELVLPDGTKVWLNAASSITYPAVFTEKERRVAVEGEVYFEVAKNKQKPFIVDAAGNYSIEVLGTNFNVNNYADDGTIKTTLTEGSIKVFSGSQKPGTHIKGIIIKPGEQAVATFDQKSEKLISDIRILRDADIDKVMAWKNGVFNFDGMSLEQAMKQLERWYDLQVIYEKGIPDIRFYGKINRDLPLSELLKALKETEIHFRIEHNRRLVILP